MRRDAVRQFGEGGKKLAGGRGWEELMERAMTAGRIQ